MATFSPPLSPSAEFSPSGPTSSRPRPVSALSNNSKRSRRSSSSGAKLDLTETHSEKKWLHTKADPTKALSEAQPASVALEESNLGDLRKMVHKDAAGNIITDPDRANPTRPRLERPLETIMSFQRNIDYTDSNRRSPYSPVSGSKVDYYQSSDSRTESNRRSSYYGGSPTSFSPQQRRGPGGGYYGRSSSYSFRPDSFIENGQGPNQYQGNRGMRNSGYGFNGEHTSPTHSHQVSYETMTSGSEENSKTTNPSSVNSSSDHIQPYRKPGDNGYEGSQMTSYGSNATDSTVTPYRPPQFQFTPIGQGGNALTLNFNTSPNGFGGMQNGNSAFSPPPANNPRVPIKLNSSSMTEEQLAAETAALSPPKEKRKSWLKRRFSKKD